MKATDLSWIKLWVPFNASTAAAWLIDEGLEVVTFKKEKHFYYATTLNGHKYSGVGYKVIFNQDGFLTLARGVDETAEICVINKKEEYFECRGLTLHNEVSGRITGKCFRSND